ncbi:MAG: methyltransferase family protein [Promethearchaeota archaeon]
MEIKKIINWLGAGLYLIAIGIPIMILLILINQIYLPNATFIIFNEFTNNLIAFLLFLIGIFIWIYSVRQIAKFLKENKLFTSGLYTYIRHPLYATILLFLIPSLVFFLRLVLVIFSIPIFFLIFHFSIKLEENQLIEKFGGEYLEYLKRTKRIIPKIY